MLTKKTVWFRHLDGTYVASLGGRRFTIKKITPNDWTVQEGDGPILHCDTLRTAQERAQKLSQETKT